MDSTAKHLQDGDDGRERDKKRAKPSPEAEPTAAPTRPRVELNPADCNLDFNVGSTGLEGQALHEGGFAYCWSGARAKTGIVKGKYCFGCKIISEQIVVMEDTAPDQQHLCRVGISRGDVPVGGLGETASSFGFGGTGKFSTGGKFSDYGTKFGVGDVIVCAVDFENKSFATIGFSKNGKWLGNAWKFNIGMTGGGATDPLLHKQAWESAYFPHVLLKNVVVQMQFSTDDGLVPVDGYKPWSSSHEHGSAISGPHFLRQEECEVLMMVGLPASGKSTWAEKWIREHPDKRYILLGTNLALDQMKVPGLLRQKNYGERFERLMDRATGIFNTLLTRAAKTPRNYIIDQTNVYKSARRRKIKEFTTFRKIAVVIFPTPDQLKIRAAKRFEEMGKEVPAEAVNEMLANFILPLSKDTPGSNELFDQVLFPELGKVEAQKHLDEMKRVLLKAPSSMKQSVSHYSHSSSIPPCDSNSHFPFPGKPLGSPLQVYHNYGEPGFFGMSGSSEQPISSSSFTRPVRSDSLRNSMPSEDSYGKYLDSGGFSYPRNGSGRFSSYGGNDSHYVKPSFERDSISHLNPCERYGENSNDNNLNYEKRNSISSFDYQSPIMTPYTSASASFAGTRFPVVDHGDPEHQRKIPSFSSGPHSGQKDLFPTQYGSHLGTQPPDQLAIQEWGSQGSNYRQRDPLPNQYGSYAGRAHGPSYSFPPAMHEWDSLRRQVPREQRDLFPNRYGSYSEGARYNPSYGRQGPSFG